MARQHESHSETLLDAIANIGTARVVVKNPSLACVFAGGDPDDLTGYVLRGKDPELPWCSFVPGFAERNLRFADPRVAMEYLLAGGWPDTVRERDDGTVFVSAYDLQPEGDAS